MKKNSGTSAKTRFKQLLKGMEKGFGNGETMQLNLCWFYDRMSSTTLAEFEEYLDSKSHQSEESVEVEKQKELGKYEF